MDNQEKVASIAYDKGVARALADAGLTKTAFQGEYGAPDLDMQPRWAVGSTPAAAQTAQQPPEAIEAPPPEAPPQEALPLEEQVPEGVPEEAPAPQSQYDAETTNALRSAYNQLLQAGYPPDVAKQYVGMLLQRMQQGAGAGEAEAAPAPQG